MEPAEINKKLIIPKEDSSTPVKASEAEFIYNFLKKHNIKKTLETGMGYGRSASHIIAATQSKHISMDPFQANYKDLALKNIESLGFSGYLDFRRDYSHNVLPELYKKNEKFDFIFIDGDHRFDGELIDFYYSDFLINNNGFILLHDTWMRSTQLLMKFIETNRKEYKKIDTGLRNLSLYQKTGKDGRDGMFFREFYTTKRILVHAAITWMSNGKKSVFKDMLYWVKEKVK